MGFNQRDLVGWCRQIIDAQEVIDRAATIKDQLPVQERRMGELTTAIDELAASLATAQQVHDRAVEQQQVEIAELQKARKAEADGLVQDRATRTAAAKVADESLRQDHLALIAQLRNERDALAAEVESLKTQRDEHKRALREARDRIAV